MWIVNEKNQGLGFYSRQFEKHQAGFLTVASTPVTGLRGGIKRIANSSHLPVGSGSRLTQLRKCCLPSLKGSLCLPLGGLPQSIGSRPGSTSHVLLTQSIPAAQESLLLWLGGQKWGGEEGAEEHLPCILTGIFDSLSSPCWGFYVSKSWLPSSSKDTEGTISKLRKENLKHLKLYVLYSLFLHVNKRAHIV